MDQEIEAALQEMIQRSWQQGQSAGVLMGAQARSLRQESLQLETLTDLRRFIKTMPENTVASIEIRVVLDNG